MSEPFTYTHETTIERNGTEHPCAVSYDVLPGCEETLYQEGHAPEIEVLAARDLGGNDFNLTRAERRFYEAQIAATLTQEARHAH